MSGLSDLSSSGAELLEQSLTQVDAQELTPPQSPAGPQQTPQQPLRVLRSNAHLVPTPPPPSQPFMQAPSIAAATGAGNVVPPPYQDLHEFWIMLMEQLGVGLNRELHWVLEDMDP